MEVWIWPENWDAWRVFEACGGCWRLTPDGRPYGLVLADVHAAMIMLDIEDANACLEKVLVMQAEALSVWSI